MKNILAKKVLFLGILLMIPVVIIAMFCGFYGNAILICFGLIYHASIISKLLGGHDSNGK